MAALPEYNALTPEDFVMPFGKHEGQTLSQILDSNPSYLDWLLSIDLQSPLKEAVEAMNEKYEREIEKEFEDQTGRDIDEDADSIHDNFDGEF